MIAMNLARSSIVSLGVSAIGVPRGVVIMEVRGIHPKKPISKQSNLPDARRQKFIAVRLVSSPS
jgi:hypothetical protein